MFDDWNGFSLYRLRGRCLRVIGHNRYGDLRVEFKGSMSLFDNEFNEHLVEEALRHLCDVEEDGV